MIASIVSAGAGTPLVVNRRTRGGISRLPNSRATTTKPNAIPVVSLTFQMVTSCPWVQAGNNCQNHQSDEIIENGSTDNDLALPILKTPQVR